jgi:acid stress chaperone HdeB
MKLRLIVMCSLAVLFATQAQAQVTVDVAKVTCRQFLIGKISTPRMVAAWLSGYYNGKRGTTMFERGDMDKNVDKLETYCRKHHDTPVMDAANAALGVAK